MINKVKENKKENWYERKEIQMIILVVLSLCIGVVYVTLCFNRNIWTDEAFTIDLLNHHKTFGSIMAYTATDVHPPLYYWILKCFTDIFGVQFTLVKVLSIVPMLLTFGLGVTYVRKRFGFWTALLFIGMTAAVPSSMEYAVQMRMYAWCMFFVTGAGFAAFDAWESGRKRSFVFLGICSVCAAYSHYFAFAAVLWIYGFLFLGIVYRIIRKQGAKGRMIGFWLTVLGSVVAYLPWVPYFMKQISGVSASYWIPEITGKVIREYFDWVFLSDYPGVVQMCQILFGAALVWLVVRLVVKHTKEDGAAFLALLVPVMVVITGVVLSKLIRPIFIIRYIMPCVPLLCFFFAVVMARLRKEVMAVLCLLLVLLTVMSYKTNYRDEYQATYTEQTLDYLEANADKEDLIIYNYGLYDFIYQCYFDNDRLYHVQDVDFAGDYDRMWFLCTVYQPMPDMNVLAANGWTMNYIGDYGIEQNEFWLYELTRE